MKRMLIFAALLAGSFTTAQAQNPEVLQQHAPNMPRSENMPAEKIEPNAPSVTGSTNTLSEKLEQTDGVIRPPETATPDITVPAPVPNPGTTPVIPAPGSPGGNQQVDPK
jgi:hypothetical protein